MVPKKIAMKSFADFVSGTESARTRILRGYKYPDEEGMAMAKYYWPAKSTIVAFHDEKHDPKWLLEQALELEKGAMTPSRSLRTKLLNNARSVKNYAEHFSGRHYEVLGNVKFPFTLGGVSINVTPDIHVADGGIEKYLKFSFSKSKLKHEYVRAMVACISYGLHIHLQVDNPDAVAFIDVPRGNVHRGLKVTDALVGEIRGQCEELEESWNLL